MKKIITIFLALIVTTTLWAQRFKVGDLYYQVVNNNDEMVIPYVDNPGYGYTTVVLYVPENTPAGCYAVGTVNNWDVRNTDLMFTPIDGAMEGWVACTFEFTYDMQVKVLAIPSDPAIALDWQFQWAKNIDPENEFVEDNVVILEGAGYLELENQGQPKLVGLEDNGVVYIEVKDWATNPVIEHVPCETAAFKHPWGDGYYWTYREATKTADATFELNARYEGVGISVATDVYGYCETWYPEDQIEFVGDIAQGDSVNFKFISEKSTFVGRMIVTLIEKGYPGNEPDEAKDITVKAKVPATWTRTITAWLWPTGADGKEVVLTKEGDWYVVTENCAELNIIFKNGEGWTGDANQTVDIIGLKENTCLVLESDGDSKATYTNVDCDNPWYMPKENKSKTKKKSADATHSVIVTYEPEWNGYSYQNLSAVTIPETVEYRGVTYEVIGIGEYAFANSPLVVVSIPSSVKYIESTAFSNCSSLLKTNYMGDLAGWCDIKFGWNSNPMQYSHNLYLNNTELKGNVVIPEGVDTIHSYAFISGHNITSVSIPNSVTSIGNCAFCYCSSLTSITIPNSVTSIGHEAFYGCSSLTSISIPNSVMSIGGVTFGECSSLTSITIPNSVTYIGESAFYGCSSLEYLSIPNSVKFLEIEDGTEYFFDGFSCIVECYNLKTLTVPADFFGVYDLADYYEGDYMEYLAYLPKQLESLTINGGNMTHPFGWDFMVQNRKSLKHIDFGATESIAEEAFTNFYNLESLVLPSQLETVPYMAVAECVKLKSISIPATVVEIEDRAFENCRMLSSVAFAENGALTRIGNWAFYNNHELTNLVIPEGVTEVGHAAFYGCTYLKEMTLPSTVQDIADNGFALCAKLQRMNVDALIPPTVAARTFEEVDRSIPVYVPDEVVPAYQAAPVWQEFNIQGKSNAPAAIDNIQSPTASNQKLLRDGQLIILRDGVEYNAMGQEL